MWSIFLEQTAELGLIENTNVIGREREKKDNIFQKARLLGLFKSIYLLLFKDLCCGRKYEKNILNLFSLYVCQSERDYIQKMERKRLFGICAALFFFSQTMTDQNQPQ